jgi:hypothetical protein
MSQIRARLTHLCDAFNAHDLDRIMNHFADDCVLEMPRGDQPWGSRFAGKENVQKALAGRFEGLPDVHYGNEQHFVDESANTGISKWTLTGRLELLRQIAQASHPLVEEGLRLGPPRRFHTPLIEPDMRSYRIRLSDKTSRLCFRVHRRLRFLNPLRS